MAIDTTKNRQDHNLRLTGNQIQFYKKVPSDLQAILGKQTITRNLKTDFPKTARMLRDEYLQKVTAEFARLRRGIQRGEYDPLTKIDAEALELRCEFDPFNEDAAMEIISRAEAIEQVHGDEAAKRYVDIAKGKRTPITDDLVARWLAEAAVSRGAQEKRTNALRRFRGWLGPARCLVEVVDRRVAGEYATYLHSELGLKPRSVNDHMLCMSALWGWLIKKGIKSTSDNPWHKQNLPLKRKPGEEPNKLPWTHAEVKRIVLALHSENAPSEDQTLLRDCAVISALSGMRSNEICSLQIKNIDLENQLFDVTQGKTAASIRKVPIHSQLREMINERLQEKGPEDYLINELRHDIAKPGERLSRLFSEPVRKLYPEYSANEQRSQALKDFHSLRRYFITAREHAKVDPVVLPRVVGHARQGMTYGLYSAGPSVNQLRECVEAVRLPE